MNSFNGKWWNFYSHNSFGDENSFDNHRPGPQLCDMNRPGNDAYDLVGFVVTGARSTVRHGSDCDRFGLFLRWRGRRRRFEFGGRRVVFPAIGWFTTTFSVETFVSAVLYTKLFIFSSFFKSFSICSVTTASKSIVCCETGAMFPYFMQQISTRKNPIKANGFIICKFNENETKKTVAG